jgi:hypothetical protein
MLMTNERGVHAEPPTPSGLVGTTIKVLSKTENWRDCVVTDCEVGGSGLRVYYEGDDGDKNDAQANDDLNGIEQATVGPHRGFRLKQRGNDTNSDGESGCKRISQT